MPEMKKFESENTENPENSNFRFLDKTEKKRILEELNKKLETFIKAQNWFKDVHANNLLKKLLSEKLEITDQRMLQVFEENHCKLKFPEIEKKLKNSDSELNRILKFLAFLRNVKNEHNDLIQNFHAELPPAQIRLNKLKAYLEKLDAEREKITEQDEKIKGQDEKITEQKKKIKEQEEKIKNMQYKLDNTKGQDPLEAFQSLFLATDNVKDLPGMDGFLGKIKTREAQAPLRQALDFNFTPAEEESPQVKLVLSEGMSSEEMRDLRRTRRNQRLKIITFLGLLGVVSGKFYLENFPKFDDSKKWQQKTELKLSPHLQELSNLNNPGHNFTKDLTIIALRSGVSSAEIDAFVEKINLMTHLPAPEIDLNQINQQFGVQYFHSLKYPNKTALQETDGLTLKFLLDGKMLVAMNYGGEAFPTDYPLTETELQKIRLEYTFTILLPNGEELMITGNFKERIEMGTNVDF